MNALICTRCGAPLPMPKAGNDVACAYCGTAFSTVEELHAEQARARDRRTAFLLDLKARLGSGEDAYAAICVSARAHLDSLGETDAVARVAVAMAADFGRDNGVDLSRDGMALARIVEAYLASLEAIRAKGRAEIRLPYLTAKDDAPLHMNVELTPQVIAKLAARDPNVPAGHAADRKHGWWPFGRG